MIKNMKIGMRLGVGFGILLLMLVATAGSGLWAVSVSTESTINMLKTDAQVAENGARARANVVGMRRFEKDFFINKGNSEKEAQYMKEWKDQREHLADRFQALDKAIDTDKDRETLKTMKQLADDYDNAFNGVVAKFNAGEIKDVFEANRAMEPHKDKVHKLEQLSKDLADEAQKRMESNEKLMEDLGRHTKVVMTILFVAAFIVSIAIGIAITRSITGPLAKAVAFANRMAEGDLTGKVNVDSRDELGHMLWAMNTMAENLRALVGKILHSSTQVASAAEEISASSEQLAKSAHAQASASEETSSTMLQMATSIQNVAANADSLATNVDEVSASIQEMGASSEQMAKSAEVMASSVSETSATIEQMTVSIEKVAKNADELASSVTETSSTVEEMTISIEQVANNSQELQRVVTDSAAIVNEMATSIRQVAKNVEEADKVAKNASKEGVAGQQAVQNALVAMKRVADVMEKTAAAIVNLGKRSEEIGSIIKVIDEIADQTNLLALNAAIEAARAGDAGRGFAVVAEEVRKLAERSMSATNEITQVIKQVQADTDNSVKYGEMASKEAKSSIELSEIAGGALQNIVQGIERTSNLMSEIAVMAGEQAAASNQVIKAADQMSQSATQVAGAAREQALGGRQIRISMERMNGITREVAGASKEQAQGSKQIRIAVENMNRVTQQVNVATKEQAISARQIVKAVDGMNAMTQTVANATSEQKKGGELVVSAVENISDLARQNLASVEQLSKSAIGLADQAQNLAGLVNEFKIQ